jgi:hypothetical protein
MGCGRVRCGFFLLSESLVGVLVLFSPSPSLEAYCARRSGVVRGEWRLMLIGFGTLGSGVRILGVVC